MDDKTIMLGSLIRTVIDEAAIKEIATYVEIELSYLNLDEEAQKEIDGFDFEWAIKSGLHSWIDRITNNLNLIPASSRTISKEARNIYE